MVDEAARLVDEVGRERLTLSELAKRLGVAQPSLYKHVDGLDGLNRLLTIQALSEVGATMRRASTGQAREDAIGA
ncbi:MAG TPA: TetR family transcriptional regulator, partial [Propionibacteriaceae bacterium]